MSWVAIGRTVGRAEGNFTIGRTILGNRHAIPSLSWRPFAIFVLVRLAFAWVNVENAPFILGQTNFFMEFDVHFYRSRLEFEIESKS